MQILSVFFCTIILLGTSYSKLTQSDWISLFDGKSLDGWKASENPDTFSVVDGMIVVDGPRAHLFYVGDVNDHTFKNFEFKADVKTTPGSNSGMYFHTEYQEDGWPSKGYEVQVNNSHTDWRRTASLYGVDDVRNAPADDNEWFTQHITVQDSLITIRVDDQIITEYVNVKELSNDFPRRLDKGTFALQGHDPESKVYYKNIMVKVLPD